MDEQRTEADTQADPKRADSRTPGGVGRLAGEDEGYAGETGAERRAREDGTDGSGTQR
jgi:hypothetical protein